MAIEPAAISAKPAVTMIPVPLAITAAAPVRPAARAKGTVRPSDIPITMSRTAAVAVKCFSTCSTDGMRFSLVAHEYCEGRFHGLPANAYNYEAGAKNQEVDNEFIFWTRSGNPDDFHFATTALRLRRARTLYRRENHGDSLR